MKKIAKVTQVSRNQASIVFEAIVREIEAASGRASDVSFADVLARLRKGGRLSEADWHA